MASQLELFFRAKGLRDADFVGKSDPFLVMFIKNPTVGQYEEVGRTETIQDNLNPEWADSIKTSYAFAEEQTVKLAVYDEDAAGAPLVKQKLLGEVEVELGVLLQQTDFPLDKKGKSVLHVNVEKVEDANEICDFNIVCEGLAKMDTFGQSDGVLKFYRSVGDVNPEWVLIHETEVAKDKKKVWTWKPFQLSSSELCNSDHLRDIRCDAYDWDSDGSHDFIGRFTFCLRDLEQGKSQFTLLDESRKGKKAQESRGEVSFNMFKITKLPTFTDYLQGGMKLAVDFAIDFTQSNGVPTDPSSLHYVMADSTQYEDAMTATAEVVLPYDSDGSALMYGFGGIFDGQRTSHCHELGECTGVDGLRKQYRDTLRSVTLSGKTYFREVLETEMAKCQSRKNTYTILVIIADGVIHDKPAVKKLLRQCTRLPLSVVVVGVGQEDFSQMEDLDDLDAEEEGKYRDVLQFVKWVKYHGNPRLFAKETLGEIPQQVVEYNQVARLRPADYK